LILHFKFTAELLSLSKANEFWDRFLAPGFISFILLNQALGVYLRQSSSRSLSPHPDGCSLTALCILNRNMTGAIRNHQFQSDETILGNVWE